MREAGFDVTHLYGLTEVYGPAVINDWHREWDALPAAEYAAKKARQGVRYTVLEGLDVLRSGDDGAGARGRRDPRRSHVPRQRGDEGLSEEPRGHRRRPSRAAGSIPATSA